MNRIPLPLFLALITVTSLTGTPLHAQARGPSAEEILETGQVIEGSPGFLEKLRQKMDSLTGLDEEARAARLAEYKAFLARLPGRYRIKGEIKSALFGSGILNPESSMGSFITGVADCHAIGEGAGVHCLLNATWPIFENTRVEQTRVPPSEQHNTFRPAVLVLGIQAEPATIRATLVTADTIAHSWISWLEEGQLVSLRNSGCTVAVSCIFGFGATARPEGDTVTLSFSPVLLSIRFDMHRDPDAELDMPLRPMKDR